MCSLDRREGKAENDTCVNTCYSCCVLHMIHFPIHAVVIWTNKQRTKQSTCPTVFLLVFIIQFVMWTESTWTNFETYWSMYKKHSCKSFVALYMPYNHVNDIIKVCSIPTVCLLYFIKKIGKEKSLLVKVSITKKWFTRANSDMPLYVLL